MYRNTYDSDDIRNVQYKILKYIEGYYNKGDTCLDLGCGSCRKIIPLFPVVGKYYAVDYNEERVATAKETCREFKNVTIGIGDNFYLPFRENTFDIVSSFMTKYSISEVYRVMKSGGRFIIETAGTNDKRKLKEMFGHDDLGRRGRMLEDTTENQIMRLKQSLNSFFEIEKIHRVTFMTKIKLNEMDELFTMTGDIRGYNRNNDYEVLLRMSDKEGYISFEEEKLIIISKKY